MLTIFGIALVVYVVVLVVGFRRVMAQRERAWREMIRRRAQDMERERLFCSMTGNELAATNRSRERFGLPPWPAKEDAPIQPAVPQDKIIADWKGRLAAAKDRERDDDTKTWPAIEEP